ncbi:hypothetical protein GXP67_16460 [Rhodocytophaga rosea]|uniref:NAD(P)-dependent oxidoreductase n=1 Tax=Rhodocytophaga rosea TaxID=2704465 RepID=A0A6C0GJA5_9BACT|nr:hypothetical protein [Rhodocytophaga rosea]QHT68118.1 hypothetical protein GXP67_16460 [Rhodocytophaga rosea]
MKTILVTGSSGQLRQEIVKQLWQKNYQVVGIDVVSAPTTTYLIDIRNKEQVLPCRLLHKRLFTQPPCMANTMNLSIPENHFLDCVDIHYRVSITEQASCQKARKLRAVFS